MFNQSMLQIFPVSPPSFCTECSVGKGWPPAPLLQKPITSALLTAAHIRPLQIPSHGFNSSSSLDVRVSDAAKRSFSDLKDICLVCKSIHIKPKMNFKCTDQRLHISKNQSFCIRFNLFTLWLYWLQVVFEFVKFGYEHILYLPENKHRVTSN